jgi:hypothetical protein
MDGYYEVKDNEDKSQYEQLNTYTRLNDCSSLYIITHLILSFFALYLSWKCANMQFNAFHFIAALCCPHLYIIWALAVHGGCGIFESAPRQPQLLWSGR